MKWHNSKDLTFDFKFLKLSNGNVCRSVSKVSLQSTSCTGLGMSVAKPGPMDFAQYREQFIVPKRKRNYWTFLRSKLWLIVCTFGCTYQCFIIISSYLEYEMITDVKIIIPNNFTPPDMILCFPSLNLVRWINSTEIDSLLTALNLDGKPEADIIAQFKASSSDEGIGSFSFFVENFNARQRFEMTLGAEEVFFRCMIVDINELLIDRSFFCSDLFKVKEFFIDTSKCFSFSPSNDLVAEVSALYQLEEIAGFLYKFIIEPAVLNRTDEATVMLLERGKYPRKRSIPSMLMRGFGRLFSITYSKYVNTLLEAPFDTDCYWYDRDGLESQGHCTEACVGNATLKEFDAVSPQTVLLPNDTYHSVSSNQIITNGSLRKQLQSITFNCSEFCKRTECFKEFYIPQLQTSYTSPVTAFQLVATTEPRVVTTYFQKLGVIEILTDFLSTIGFWFGISILQAQDLVDWAHKKYEQRYHLKSSVKSARSVKRRASAEESYVVNQKANSRRLNLGAMTTTSYSLPVTATRQGVRKTFAERTLYTQAQSYRAVYPTYY